MTIDERIRLHLRQWFIDHMNEELADAMMEAMPAVDHSELATKSDVERSQLVLRTDMAELRGEFAEVRGEFAELKGEFAELKVEFVGLKGDFAELRVEFAELKGDLGQLSSTLEARIDQKFVSQTRWLVGTQFAAVGLLGGVIAIVAGIS